MCFQCSVHSINATINLGFIFIGTSNVQAARFLWDFYIKQQKIQEHEWPYNVWVTGDSWTGEVQKYKKKKREKKRVLGFYYRKVFVVLYPMYVLDFSIKVTTWFLQRVSGWEKSYRFFFSKSRFFWKTVLGSFFLLSHTKQYSW